METKVDTFSPRRQDFFPLFNTEHISSSAGLDVDSHAHPFRERRFRFNLAPKYSSHLRVPASIILHFENVTVVGAISAGIGDWKISLWNHNGIGWTM